MPSMDSKKVIIFLISKALNAVLVEHIVHIIQVDMIDLCQLLHNKHLKLFWSMEKNAIVIIALVAMNSHNL